MVEIVWFYLENPKFILFKFPLPSSNDSLR